MPKRKRSSKDAPAKKRSKNTRYIGMGNPAVVAVTSGSNNTVLPQSIVTKLRYSPGTAIGLNPSLGTPTVSQFFRATSVNAPDFIGGHQPMGFDQMSAMYQRYTVLKSKIYVTFSQNANQFDNVTVFIRRLTSATTSDRDAILETAHTQYRILGSDGAPKSLKMDFNFKKMFPGASVMDDKYSALINADPSDNYYYEIGCFGTNASLDPLQILATVLIEYEVLFHDPAVLTTS